MRWRTALTDVRNNKELVRGYNLKDLIHEKSFVETIYLVLKGELPTVAETRMMDALFTAAIDHGIGVSSAMTARTVVSTGNSLHTALAAGILSLGTLHGSAIEGAAQFFQDHANEADVPALVARLKDQKVRIPGYGHKILSHDPRSEALFAIAKVTGFYGRHSNFAEAVHQELNKVSAK